MSTGSTALQAQYEELKARGLALDLTRGKPSPEQLDLSSQLLSIDLAHDFRDEAGTDLRNYGGFDGILELRELFGELLGIPAAQLLAGNNASLGFMHDVITHALLHGVPGSERPWRDDDVAFLCPVPGYDRHFAILEALGIRMIAVPPAADGGLDLASIASYLGDPVGARHVGRADVLEPDRSHPRRRDRPRARLAARGGPRLPPVLGQRLRRAPPHRRRAARRSTSSGSRPRRATPTVRSCSRRPRRSRTPAPGSRSSPRRRRTSTGTASTARCSRSDPDKLNQQRHLRFFGDAEGVRKHMRAHREIIAPKFAAVERILTERLSGHARWSDPKGGYFVTLEAPEGTATRAVELAKAAGIAVTPAGSPYPYGDDPRDSVIRIAPTMPSLADVEAAIDGLCTCVLLAEEERALRRLTC